jgi:hypothetical protein
MRIRPVAGESMAAGAFAEKMLKAYRERRDSG